MDDELRHTAIHEAGHAVVGRVLKQVCGSATIDADYDLDEAGHDICAEPWITLGRWWGDGPDTATRPHGTMKGVMLGRIICYMAGWLAEEECLRQCAGGDEDDHYQVDLMLASTLPDDADLTAYAARIERFGRAIVRRHKETIERVGTVGAGGRGG